MDTGSNTASRRSGRIAAVAILALAVLLLLGSGRIEYAFSSDPLGPRAFPYLLGATLAILAVWYWLRPGEAESWPATGTLAQSALLIAVVAAAVVLMPSAGFVLSASVIAAFVSWQFGATPAYAAVSGIGQGIFWFAIFKYALGTYLPSGTLFFPG